MYKYIFITIFIFNTKLSYATGQFGDILIVGSDTNWIYSNPLEEYFREKGNRKIGDKDFDAEETCTALWRGYVATWKLENDSLFLVRLQSDYCGNPIDVPLDLEFGANRVFAYWVNFSLVKPEGEMLQYIHAGYMSIYEGMTYIEFQAGIIHGTKTENYLDRNNELIFPEEYYLTDTIRTLILGKIDSDERDKLPNFGSCSLVIEFDETGHITKIGLYNDDLPNSIELLVITSAQEALEHFPQLMQVNHPNYRPPVINLFFSAHCLKHPYDRDYGCKYE